jgi:AraC-like DNA-binding protein/quercetin dioxygenase-like cupin family protein
MMAVSAQSVNDRAPSASPAVDLGLIDLRAGGGATGGSLVYQGERLTTGFHHHDLHQIEYAMQGVVEVETSDGTYLLPPHQAAWIPARCRHQATLHASVTTISVLFEPSLVPHGGTEVRILHASPLIREMVNYAVRWPITRRDDDPVADHFFRTLGHLVGDELGHESRRALPTSDDPLVAAALDHTQRHLADVTIGEVCAAIGVSERTLRRRFAANLGMSWRSYLVRARILRSMALLTEPGSSVLGVSLEVGFDNVSAFARAFSRHAGEAPSTYRRRSSGSRPAAEYTLRSGFDFNRSPEAASRP